MDLTQSNLNVAGPYGTVELSQSGANVNVTIAMNSGFSILVNGGDIGVNTTGGLVLNGSTLTNFSIASLSTTLKNNGTIGDRKSTRLNSSHSQISYAVFCLKKKIQPPHAGRKRPGLELNRKLHRACCSYHLQDAHNTRRISQRLKFVTHMDEQQCQILLRHS